MFQEFSLLMLCSRATITFHSTQHSTSPFAQAEEKPEKALLACVLLPWGENLRAFYYLTTTSTSGDLSENAKLRRLIVIQTRPTPAIGLLVDSTPLLPASRAWWLVMHVYVRFLRMRPHFIFRKISGRHVYSSISIIKSIDRYRSATENGAEKRRRRTAIS